jgi:hypothetical protein
MKGSSFFIAIAIAGLCAMASIATAATVTSNLTYQGTLTDSSGNPLTGTYTMTFRWYDVASGGTAIGTEIQDVPVKNGLFTTTLQTSSQYVDGTAYWLGIKVGADPEMTPRQEIRPVPYALSLRPGARIIGSGVPEALNVTNSGDTVAGISVTTSGLNSTAIYGSSLRHYGIYGIGREGGFFTTVQNGTGPNPLAGVHVITEYERNPGVQVLTTANNSPGVNAWTKGQLSDAVRGIASGADSAGVRGSGYNRDTYGVYAEASHDNSTAIFAYTNSEFSPGVKVFTWGHDCPGVQVKTDWYNSPAILATARESNGIYATSAENVGIVSTGTEGGFFTTNGPGAAITPLAGVNISTQNNYNPGIKIRTSGDGSPGVDVFTSKSHGVNITTTGPNNHAIVAHTQSTASDGLYVETNAWGSWGVDARTSGDSSYGVSGSTTGPNSFGVNGFSAQSYGMYGHTGNANSYGIYTPDRLYAGGGVFQPSDVAEYMPVSETVIPGTVLVIGDDGKLQVTSTAYDTRVAGIVSTAPGISLGAKENGNDGEQIIAVSGRVPCKVDATRAPIHAGDLLTTSDMPGYAMKAIDPKIGTVLGKAMGSLETGIGTIEVLVTLQ